MNWKLLTFITCSFGFFRDLRPSEAYLSAFLTGPTKNFTIPEVNNAIFPWWTYSYLFWLIPAFLLTDYFRYKPVLVIDSVAYITTFAMILWAKTLPLMKTMELCYGLAAAGEIGYYSYLYSIVPKDHFKQISSFTRAASNAARFTGCLFCQLVVSFNLMSLFYLNVVSFADVSVSLLISFLLPRAASSDIFNAVEENSNQRSFIVSLKQPVVEPTKDSFVENDTKEGMAIEKRQFIVKTVLKAVREVYQNKTVILWSIWWVFGSLSTFQMGNYIQNLWKQIANETNQESSFNGAVEASTALFCSVCILLVGLVHIDFSKGVRSELLMASVCGLNSALLILEARTSNLWISYFIYGLLRAIYQVVLTIATTQIANSLKRARYGFVFGCNMFMALVIETIVTAVVIDDVGLGVDVRTQFSVYGYYYIMMMLVFLFLAIFGCARMRKRKCTESSDAHFKTSQLVYTIAIDLDKEIIFQEKL